MPIVLNDQMTADEIINAVISAYGDPSNYIAYEIDHGAGKFGDMPAWIERDNGDYARRAAGMLLVKEKEVLKFLKERRLAREKSA